jgi:hypothetical protein
MRVPKGLFAAVAGAIVIIVGTISGYYLLTPYQQQSWAFSCPAMITSPSIIDAEGFLSVANKHDGRTGLDEFVLSPNSAGHVTVLYEPIAGSNGSVEKLIENIYDMPASSFIKPIETLYTINKGKLSPTNSSEIGIEISPSSIISLQDGSLQVVYQIVADSSAVRGTYLIGIWQTCPGALVTVGEKPYEGSLPWNRGIFH